MKKLHEFLALTCDTRECIQDMPEVVGIQSVGTCNRSVGNLVVIADADQTS